MDSRSTASIGGLAALATAAAGLAVTAAPAQSAAMQQEPGACRVVRLAEPDGMAGGSVIDIEKVGDQVVYYGNSKRGTGRREKQRAYVWTGLRAEPTRVGPRTRRDLVIAYELTDTGLINGSVEDHDSPEVRSWVQDLATGEIWWLDHDSGPRGEDHGFTWVRRINRHGAATGAADRADEPGADAIGFDSPTADLEFLADPADYLESSAIGINGDGDRAGFYADEFLVPEDQFWTIWEPTVFHPDGSRTPLATPYGVEGAPREIKDDGSASGAVAIGEDPPAAHIEAGYWPTPDENIALGLLPGGDYSEVYGADEGGHLAGLANRLVKPSKYAPEGFADYSFVWSPETAEGTIRVLPSPIGLRQDLPWRKWVNGVAHGVNGELDLVGTAGTVKFAQGQPVYAPTVYVNASQCGREVATSHELPGDGRRTSGSLVREWKRTALD